MPMPLKYRRNLITVFEGSSRHLLTDHKDKAELIWHSFKERLGVTAFTGISFNLSELLHTDNDLSSLVASFDQAEIDLVVKSLPSDKAPGPDGFNTDFIKRCWPIICTDFYNLNNAFYLGNVCM